MFFTVFGQLIMYPMRLVWPLAGLAIAITVVLGVLAHVRAQVLQPGLIKALCGVVVVIGRGAIHQHEVEPEIARLTEHGEIGVLVAGLVKRSQCGIADRQRCRGLKLLDQLRIVS